MSWALPQDWEIRELGDRRVVIGGVCWSDDIGEMSRIGDIHQQIVQYTNTPAHHYTNNQLPHNQRIWKLKISLLDHGMGFEVFGNFLLILGR